jgi:hypothetical protein
MNNQLLCDALEARLQSAGGDVRGGETPRQRTTGQVSTGCLRPC